MEHAGAHGGDHVYEAAIIGTGFSGLCLAIKLKAAGIDDIVVLEKADDVGGVWRDNTYPGCACDVPSALYSFSFEPNPSWSRMYPTQPELLAYLRHCARKYQVLPHVRFGHEVQRSAFDERQGTWTISCKNGVQVRARALAHSGGGLNRPAIPELPGLSNFAGPAFHSAQWKHDVDLRGKRVAVIGTGASSIQIVPQLAARADKLYVLQRTPPWVLPKEDPPFSTGAKRMFQRFPPAQRALRAMLYFRHELAALNFVKANPRISRIGERIGKQHLRDVIPDRTLRKALTPDYRIGCKRVLLSNDYLQAFTRPNVQLITAGVREVRANGIETDDGAFHELDAIVFGTGFKATEFVTPLEFVGLNGRSLAQEWKTGAPSYLGIAATGYPNLYIMTGPNTGLGHNSMVFMIEAQVHYIVQCIARRQREGLRYLEVKQHALERFNDELQTKMQGTVWLTGGCQSWYLGADGRNFTLWPGFTVSYWWRTRRPKWNDFTLQA